MTRIRSARVPQILLHGPGPSPVAPEVLAAMAAPTIGHLDGVFLQLMDQVQADLRTLFGTESAFTLPISGTGSAGMEAAIVNTVECGDRVVIGVHGVFGGRMVELCRRQGAEVVAVEAPFGSALDQEAMAVAIRGGDTKLAAFVHAETSTGVLQPFDGIVAAAREVGALVLADCVTSLGGLHLNLDAAGVDLAYSGTQKCLSVPPGLAPMTVSPRAMERVAARTSPSTSWYLDFGLLSGYWGEDSSRAYHHTAPIQMVYALAAGLEAIFDEGLDACVARHRAAAESFYAGLEALGLRCLVPAELRTPMLTSVVIPDGVADADVRRRMRAIHQVEIGGGLGTLAGKVWRVGLMGHGARLDNVLRVLAALGDSLQAAGHAADVGGALSAASARHAQMVPR